jgi:hypothetical protein
MSATRISAEDSCATGFIPLRSGVSRAFTAKNAKVTRRNAKEATRNARTLIDLEASMDFGELRGYAVNKTNRFRISSRSFAYPSRSSR